MASRWQVSDLRSRIEWALSQLNCRDSPPAVPVDLAALCATLGIEVEWRWMIPEGVMVENAGKLRICLQSNFRDGQRITRRQRFTWAHEICHALFYDQTEGLARLMPGAPSRAALERMCQQGAGYLLIPSSDFAGACSREKPVPRPPTWMSCRSAIKSLPDVMLRRLHESGGSLLNDYAILLLRTREGHSRIDAAAFGPWLRAHIDAPEIGQAFDQSGRSNP